MTPTPAPFFTSIILPTYYRPERVTKTLESLVKTMAYSPAYEIVILPMRDDLKTMDILLNYIKRLPLIIIPRDDQHARAIPAWNCGFAHAASRADGFFLGADDLIFHPGWLQEIMGMYESMGLPDVLIGANDGHRDGVKHATHYLATREFILRHNHGVFACPHYIGWFLDLEISDRAKAVDRYFHCPRALVEHMHTAFKKAEVDLAYQHGYLATGERDKEMYERRKRLNFPDDYDPIILA